MIYNARKRHIPVIDATSAITCIHQNHDYNHLKNVADKNYAGPESLRNRALVGGLDNTYSIIDANWVIRDHTLSRQFINPMRRPVNKVKMTMIKPLSVAKRVITSR